MIIFLLYQVGWKQSVRVPLKHQRFSSLTNYDVLCFHLGWARCCKKQEKNSNFFVKTVGSWGWIPYLFTFIWKSILWEINAFCLSTGTPYLEFLVISPLGFKVGAIPYNFPCDIYFFTARIQNCSCKLSPTITLGRFLNASLKLSSSWLAVRPLVL